MRIDSHQHYWEPRRGDYDWMPKGDPVLDRPYGPADLAPALERCGITGTVVVQAAATVEETEYMLGIADAADTVAGVVGWVDFEQPGHRRHLERLARHPKLVGVRLMIQDIPDVDWMLRGDVQWAYRVVIDADLAFDALGFPPHLDNFLTIFKRHPGLRVVIDHCMKPRIRDRREDPAGAFDRWAERMSRIVDETGAFCKLSGLITEANEDWTVEDLRPFADHVLSAFGPERVMWGSDWPVCRRRASYEAWCEAADALTAHLDGRPRSGLRGNRRPLLPPRRHPRLSPGVGSVRARMRASNGHRRSGGTLAKCETLQGSRRTPDRRRARTWNPCLKWERRPARDGRIEVFEFTPRGALESTILVGTGAGAAGRGVAPGSCGDMLATPAASVLGKGARAPADFLGKPQGVSAPRGKPS